MKTIGPSVVEWSTAKMEPLVVDAVDSVVPIELNLKPVPVCGVVETLLGFG